MRLTLPLVKVVSALLGASDEDHYGLDLMKQTRLSSGTLYPLLQRLEQSGWIVARWEEIDPVEACRPARRYYRLTPLGVSSARSALAELHAAMTPKPRLEPKASPTW